jgi:hypothetical protein
VGGARFTKDVCAQLLAAQLESVMGPAPPSSDPPPEPELLLPDGPSSPAVASSNEREPELDPEGPDPELEVELALKPEPEEPPEPGFIEEPEPAAQPAVAVESPRIAAQTRRSTCTIGDMMSPKASPGAQVAQSDLPLSLRAFGEE